MTACLIKGAREEGGAHSLSRPRGNFQTFEWLDSSRRLNSAELIAIQRIEAYMTIDTTCPECGAPYAKKLSLLYSEGRSTVQVENQSNSSFNTVGRHKIATVGTSSGIQQTESSRAATPPQDVPTFTPPTPTAVTVVSLVTGFGFIIAVIVAISTDVSFLMALLYWVAAIAVAMMYRSASKDPEKEQEIERLARAEYDESVAPQRKALEDWSKTFQCGSCGHRFIPDEPQA